MTEAGRTRGSAKRHALGVLLFPVIGFVVGISWLVVTAKFLGVGTTGFGNAAIILVMPVWALLMGALLWLPWWLIHRRFLGRMSGVRALLSGAAIGVLVTMVMTGPAGFTMRGGAELLGYAIMAVMAAGGMAHNAILNRPSK